MILICVLNFEKTGFFWGGGKILNKKHMENAVSVWQSC